MAMETAELHLQLSGQMGNSSGSLHSQNSILQGMVTRGHFLWPSPRSLTPRSPQDYRKKTFSSSVGFGPG